MTDSLPISRPRRSVLYLPASNSKALVKAKTLKADSLIFDLEDAVLPEAKVTARQQLYDALLEDAYEGKEKIVRINAINSPWGRDDLSVLAKSAADAFLIPKVETAKDVQSVADLLLEAGAGDNIELWAMIETPLGVLNCQEIAAHPQMRVLVMGTNDLSKELRVAQTPERGGFITSFGLCILAARAYHCDIIDGVHIHIKDEAGLLAVCQQGKALGFDGKSLIHPAQLAIANKVFSPAEEELRQAEAIIEAWRQAKREGKGVVLVDGRLVEELHVKDAERLLSMAERLQR